MWTRSGVEFYWMPESVMSNMQKDMLSRSYKYFFMISFFMSGGAAKQLS